MKKANHVSPLELKLSSVKKNILALGGRLNALMPFMVIQVKTE